MELNLIATGIELLGASVAKLTVDNTIVDIENDAQRSFGMTINEPQFQNIEKTKAKNARFGKEKCVYGG